jgi:uroporphyrinogen-III synthase
VRVLVTRPEPQASATAARLAARGHTAVLAPVLETIVEPFAPIETAGVAAIAVTSRAALDALAGRPDRDALLRLPVFAVGDATAAAARRAGFAEVRSGGGAVGDLARLLAADLPPGATVLHLAGRDRAGDIAAALAPSGIAVRTAVLYRTAPVAALPPRVAAAVAAGEIDAVVAYSPRSAEALVAAAAASGVAAALLALPILCLSEAVAAPLAAAGAARPSVAARPNEAALLALLDAVADGG